MHRPFLKYNTIYLAWCSGLISPCIVFVHSGRQNAKWCKASSHQETQDASICFKALTQVSLHNNTQKLHSSNIDRKRREKYNQLQKLTIIIANRIFVVLISL